ncbi:hypothetical protein [Bacillus sp. JJ1562]|uniref:hypothetical protein n=1 Tax=Bacillus sp. JJ1562 TaxID=3122960 RepID=UPI003003A0CA
MFKAVSSILQGSRYSINFIMIIFYVFYFIPIGLDIVFGIPVYTYETSFILASHDTKTSLIYNIFIAMVPVIWSYTAISRVNRVGIALKNKQPISMIIYIIGLLSPILLLLFSPSPFMYEQYGRAVQGFPTLEAGAYHAFISGATFLSAISYFLLLIENKRRECIFVILFGTPFLFISIWLNGKRGIVALILVLLIYALWKRNVLRPINLLLVTIVFTGMLLSFSSLYQQTFRYNMLQINNWEEVYQNLRVDMGRDDVTKMAIYAQVSPEKLEILDHPFQSYLFTVIMFVPRELWSGKPWPYAVYATSALLQIPNQYVGWSMTTGILDETIANVGWLGFLLGPLIISCVVRIGDRNQTTVIQLFTILVGSLMLVLQIAAFAPIFLLWILLVGWQMLRRNRQALPNDEKDRFAKI